MMIDPKFIAFYSGMALIESVGPRALFTSPRRGEVDLRSKSGEGHRTNEGP
jgi:hypothetical protein